MSRLNPIILARWGRFNHHRLGYWSLWLLALLFFLCLGAELLA
ncbi:ABC transporter permease, partial [Erwinia amylovora]|nr:ABC transporter permease [Erwinia amylovora]